MKSSIFNRNSSRERRLKFIASGDDDDIKKPRAKHREHRQEPSSWHRLAQRRQRRYHSDHKHVQRQRQNTTAIIIRSTSNPKPPQPTPHTHTHTPPMPSPGTRTDWPVGLFSPDSHETP